MTERDRTLLKDLQSLLEASTRGDPQSPLLWTSKSTRHLADALGHQGHHVSHDTVARLLDELHYSLQANRKTKEGSAHPDRDAQFEHINKQVRAFQKRGHPVVSVDTKKKALIGDFKNAGHEWHPQGQPIKVRSKDVVDKHLGKGIPYGVYDITANNGWVSVGIDHDTAQFAAESLHRWWQQMGSRVYPTAKALLVTADAGGSNGYRLRLWKVALQALADAIGIRISVCHFPPGTSKWNKIEHRMFCHITENWRGKPLVSRAVIVNLIGNTKTRTGLTIKAELDESRYPTGIKVSDEELAAVRIKREEISRRLELHDTAKSVECHQRCKIGNIILRHLHYMKRNQCRGTRPPGKSGKRRVFLICLRTRVRISIMRKPRTWQTKQGQNR